jgi:hypothetical protein
MQPPAGGCRETHEKTRTVHSVRENASFSEVVGILENAQVAEEGLELVVVFRGKSYTLSDAGQMGDNHRKHGRKKTRGKACAKAISGPKENSVSPNFLRSVSG